MAAALGPQLQFYLVGEAARGTPSRCEPTVGGNHRLAARRRLCASQARRTDGALIRLARRDSYYSSGGSRGPPQAVLESAKLMSTHNNQWTGYAQLRATRERALASFP